MNYKRLLSSKITILILLSVLVFVGNLKFKQWQNAQKIEKEKLSLQKQAEELQKKNEELEASLQYLNSPSFKERVARQQLNLKKEGEQVFSFADAKQEPTLTQTTPPSNFEKWWNYFFTN